MSKLDTVVDEHPIGDAWKTASQEATPVDNTEMALELSERARRIPAYPGARHYSQDVPDGTGAGGSADDFACLASNESPFGMLDGVKEAVLAALNTLNRYPDPTNAKLRKRLSERYEVASANIAIGNGSCDILLAAGEALLEPGSEVIYAWPSFSVYPHLAAAAGARPIRVDLDNEGRHDLEAMLREITVATRLVIVCNPNNPTSTAIPLSEIAEFMASVPKHVSVIVDEAYCDFNLLNDPDESLVLLRQHPNLSLLRTFSKVHGLCGLRVGFALCGSSALPQALDLVRQPFYCSGVAQEAAMAALRRQDLVEKRVAAAVVARDLFDERLRQLGFEPADSQANFVWFELGTEFDEAAVIDGLEQRKVLVRGGSALGSTNPALRVTYGLHEENLRFLDALAEITGRTQAFPNAAIS